MIHMEPVQFIVRSYEGNDSYLNKDPYIGVMNVNIDGDRAYAFAMHGELCKNDYEQFLDELRYRGVKKLEMHRHGIRQVIRL